MLLGILEFYYMLRVPDLSRVEDKSSTPLPLDNSNQTETPVATTTPMESYSVERFVSNATLGVSLPWWRNQGTFGAHAF